MKCILLMAAVLLPGLASAQVTIPSASVPSDLAMVRGKGDRFTLSAEGQPDGLILDDGTEVHVRAYLARKLSAAVHRGEPVTVRGLRASGMPFFSASSVSSDLNHQVVTDTGNPGLGEIPQPTTGTPVSLEGTIARAIHRSDGAVIGAFLSNGTEVRMPDGVSADWPNLFKPGETLAVTGQDIQTEYGRVIRIETLGPSASQLSPVAPGYQPPPRPSPAN
jgi:hypothetical protein